MFKYQIFILFFMSIGFLYSQEEFRWNDNFTNNISIHDTVELGAPNKAKQSDFGIKSGALYFSFYNDSKNLIERYDLHIVYGHKISHYYLESSVIPFATIKNDPYNSGSENYSISLIPNLAFIILSEKYDNLSLLFINSIFNGRHNVSLTEYSTSDPGFLLSFYVKNHTDFFVFKETKWINMSPGIGVSFVFDKGINFSVGCDLNLMSDFHDIKSKICGNFSAGLFLAHAGSSGLGQ